MAIDRAMGPFVCMLGAVLLALVPTTAAAQAVGCAELASTRRASVIGVVLGGVLSAATLGGGIAVLTRASPSPGALVDLERGVRNAFGATLVGVGVGMLGVAIGFGSPRAAPATRTFACESSRASAAGTPPRDLFVLSR